MTKIRHVLMGQIPPQQQPPCHGQQLYHVSSLSKLSVKGNGLETNFCHVYTVTLTLEIWPGVKVMIRLCEILSRSDIAVRSFDPDTVLGMCALWPWPWIYDLGSMSWHTLGSWATIVWNIIQVQLGSEELWPGYRFSVCVHCNLDLGDMNLGQDHDTSLGDG